MTTFADIMDMGEDRKTKLKKRRDNLKKENEPVRHVFNRLNNKQLTDIIREHNLDAMIKPYYHKNNEFIVKKLLEHLTIDNDGYIVIKEHNVVVKPPLEGRFKEPTEEEKKERKTKKTQKAKEYREKKKTQKKEEEEKKKKEEEEKNKETQKERLRKQRQDNKDRREKEAKEKEEEENKKKEPSKKKEKAEEEETKEPKTKTEIINYLINSWEDKYLGYLFDSKYYNIEKWGENISRFINEKEKKNTSIFNDFSLSFFKDFNNKVYEKYGGKILFEGIKKVMEHYGADNYKELDNIEIKKGWLNEKNRMKLLKEYNQKEEEEPKTKQKYSYNKEFYDVLNNPNDESNDSNKTGEELYNEMYGSGFSTDMKKLILDAQKAGDFYYTPKSTVDFIYKQLTPNKTYRLLDPSAGLGNLLVGAVENQNKFNFERIDANDLNPSSMEVLKDNLKIDNYYINNFTYETKQLNNDYNLIIMNPPFSSEIDYSHNKVFVNKEKEKLKQKIKSAMDKKENIPDIKNLMIIDKANYQFKPEQKGYLFHLIKAITMSHTETKEIYSIMPFNWIKGELITLKKTYNLREQIKGDLKERIKIALKIDDIPNIDLIPIKNVNDFYHLKKNGKVAKFGGSFYLFKGIIKKEEEPNKKKKEEPNNKKKQLEELNKEIETMINQLQKNNTKEKQKELKILIDKQNNLIDEINEMK